MATERNRFFQPETFYFQWHLTNRCNLRCRHCYQNDYQGPDDSLSLRVAQKLIDQLKARGGQASLDLTGGEPFLLGQTLFDLLDFLNDSPEIEELKIISNGLLFSSSIQERLSCLDKLSTIKISLEGACPGTNDWIRGKNEFARAVEKIDLIDKNRFSVVLMFTLTKRNLDELELMLHLAYELGVDGLIIERFVPEGRGKKMTPDLLQAKDWKKVLNWITEKIGEEDISPLLPYRAFWIQLRPEFQILGAPCNLGESLCLMPDGTFFPCRRFAYPLGNIFQNDFGEILKKSPFLQRIKQKENLEGKCKSCPIKECSGCRALAFALFGNPLAEDVQCPWE